MPNKLQPPYLVLYLNGPNIWWHITGQLDNPLPKPFLEPYTPVIYTFSHKSFQWGDVDNLRKEQ